MGVGARVGVRDGVGGNVAWGTSNAGRSVALAMALGVGVGVMVALAVGLAVGVRVSEVGVALGRGVGERSASSGEMGFTEVTMGRSVAVAVGAAGASASTGGGVRCKAIRLAAPRQYSDEAASTSAAATPSPIRCHSPKSSKRVHARSACRASQGHRRNTASRSAALNDESRPARKSPVFRQPKCYRRGYGSLI
jgi:hypothetical protein